MACPNPSSFHWQEDTPAHHDGVHGQSRNDGLSLDSSIDFIYRYEQTRRLSFNISQITPQNSLAGINRVHLAVPKEQKNLH